MLRLKWIGLALVPAMLALAVSLAPSNAPGAIGVGDVANYTWHAPLFNGMGVTSLEELRGKPVLFDFWGWH